MRPEESWRCAMAERTAVRVARLLSIVTYLATYGPTPFADLARHFGVSEQAIIKDVELLWMTGLPGYMHDDLLNFNPDSFDAGIAELVEDQGLRQVRLSTHEGIAVIAALSTMVNTGVAPPAAVSALAKVRDLVRDEVVSVEAEQPVDAAITQALNQGVHDGVVVDLDYIDAAGRKTQRAIHPHRLVVMGGRGYVECYCERAQDYRTLRVDRIVAARVTATPVTTQPTPNPGRFAHHRHYEATVTVQRSARWVVEAFEDCTITEDHDRIIASFPVYEPRWVASRLAVAGGGLVSVEPSELRAELAQVADAVLSAHRD